MTLSGEKLVYPLTNGESLDASEIHAIRVQLKKIFESSMFQHSDRMRRFLDFAVEQSINGHSNEVKEYTVAREVFDKPEDFDGRIDAIVRVEAGRLRMKLLEFYSTDGRKDPVLISFGTGYVPEIRIRTFAD